jgi:hypothetical protein
MKRVQKTPVQHAWEGLANTMRLYVESKLRFKDLFEIDREEAVNNQDRAIEAKLEKFHVLYDVTKNLPGFDYFGHGDTSLLIVLRNAIHHRDHTLFHSWNALIGLDGGMRYLAGAEFLLGSTTPDEDLLTVRFYYLLDDFYARLSSVKNPQRLQDMWNSELQFAAVGQAGVNGRYPVTQVYVDVMPAFITAIHRVRSWLASTGFTPSGDDGRTYFRSFGDPPPAQRLGFRTLRMP